MTARPWAAFALAACLVACGSAEPPPAAAPATPADPRLSSRQPDIVVVLADDLDARPLEDVAGLMPFLREEVAPAGVSFTRSYVSTPLCCPSRVSILTGRYPHNTGVVSNSGPDGGFAAFHRSGGERTTVATMLRAEGYRTGLIGKYMNGYPGNLHAEYVPPGWDEWHAALTLGVYFDYYTSSDGRVVFNGHSEADYSTDVLARRAREFIARSAEDERPFFLLVSLIAPHKPALPAPRHGAAFPGLLAPRPPSFDEADISDKPPWVLRKPEFDSETVRLLDRLYRRRLQSMQAVDDLLRGVVAQLEASQRLAGAYLFFTSDNGWMNGEHRYPEGKALMYEESIRVPLVVRGPRVRAGSTSADLVSNVDLLPTWLDLAGASVPDALDGRSLLPLLTGPPPAVWREELLFEYLERDGPESPPFFGLRTADWAYASYEDGQAELYDMRADPWQLRNVAHTAGDVRARLDARLAVLSRCAGASCR